MNKTQSIVSGAGSYLNESMTQRPLGSGEANASAVTMAEMKGRKKHNNAAIIDIDRIMPDPDQPRKDFDKEALEQLAHSLKTKTQLQPIRVRWDGTLDKYVIIAGERRYRAAKLANLPTLDCVVHDKVLSDDDRLEIQLVENCVREDLNPIEEAKAFKELMTKKAWSQVQLAEALKMGRSTVVVSLSLLKLPDDIQEQVSKGKLPPAVAREIAKLPTVEEQQAMAERYRTDGLSSDAAAKEIQVKKGTTKQKAAQSKKLSRTWADGQKLTLTTKRKESNAEIANRLQEWAAALLSDARPAKAA